MIESGRHVVLLGHTLTGVAFVISINQTHSYDE